MGRYTTVQTYTDQDAKVAAIGYAEAASGQRADGGGRDLGPMAVKRGDAGGNGSDDKFRVNRVENVSGSSAGAGSGDFHMYRAARRRELERVQTMEKEHARRKEQEAFEVKRQRNIEEFEARAAKRAEKRRRRKDRAKARALDDAVDAEEDETASADEAHATTANKRQKTDANAPSLPETPGGVPAIPDDGSFLERMLALQKQQQEEQKPKETTEPKQAAS